jgi:two-component system phosphate regulon response regulator PhoB
MAQVLVVDDDRAIREMLRVALEVEGYTVSMLDDGRRVAEMLMATAEPCVVLMDLMMPGMSGWEVCLQLLGDPRLARHPVAVMTAGLMKGDACPAPARALLCKPFELDQIYALVESLTAEALAEPAAMYAPAASVA